MTKEKVKKSKKNACNIYNNVVVYSHKINKQKHKRKEGTNSEYDIS